MAKNLPANNSNGEEIQYFSIFYDHEAVYSTLLEVYGIDAYETSYHRTVKLLGNAFHKECILVNILRNRRENKTDIYDIHNLPRPRNQGIRVYSSSKEV